jgi:Protein of unknown function (DUF2628)/zinc-ribbon domain
MKCQNCGATLSTANSFCGYCGTPLAIQPTAAVANAVATPARTTVAPAGSDATPAELSAPWGPKFALIEKAGGVKLPNVKSLTFGERAKLSFNVWAFLFGMLYYFAKGMPKKGISLFGLAVLISLVLEEIGGFGQEISPFVMGVLFSTRANIDYYKKIVLKDDGWW